jgi:hypothetical protein
MLDVIVAMGGILATWALAGAGFVGLGYLVARLVGASSGHWSWGRMFWGGWAAAIVLLQAWHVALPVDGRAVVALAIASAMGWFLRGADIRDCREGSSIGRQECPPHVARGMVMTALFVANLALGTPQNYDTGLYHLQAVRWNEQFAIVPGLGNLHGRLAFNNSSFLYAAMFDVGPWNGRSHHLASGLLSLVVLLQLIARLPGAFRRDPPRSSGDLFGALMLPAALLFSYKQMTSYAPDLVVFLLGIVITLELWELLVASEGSLAEKWDRLVWISLVSAAGVTVKLSFLPMAVATMLVACAACGNSSLSGRRKIALVVIPLAILALWGVRGVVLSGYPAYPQTAFAADVAWRVPFDQAQRDLDDILAWARDRDSPTSAVVEGSGWIVAWAARQFRDVLKVTLPLSFFMLAGVSTVALRWRRGQRGVDRGAWALVPSLATILFVLATAPDLSRFAGASTWVLAAGATVLLLDELARNETQAVFDRVSRMVAVIAAVLLVVAIVKASRYLNGPGESGAFRPIPVARLARFETDWGLAVWVPYRLPTEAKYGEDQAWDAPLPSTPYFNPRLSLRQPDDPGRGFVVRSD